MAPTTPTLNRPWPPTATIIPTPTRSGRIAFDPFRDGNFEIYMMNADGAGQTRLTNNPAGDYSAA
jgi:hypothetical protein